MDTDDQADTEQHTEEATSYFACMDSDRQADPEDTEEHTEEATSYFAYMDSDRQADTQAHTGEATRYCSFS